MIAPPAAINVWLEPGYDGGRFGAWMLDFPGCFVWGRDRDVALARVPSAVGAFAWWLGEHGDAILVPDTDALNVVEEVAAATEDGYERNPTFDPDRAPVSNEALEAAIRRIGFAREDLAAVVARGAAIDAGADRAISSRGEAGEDRPPRSFDDVLRHIAGVEIWLAGRLDPRARYDGPGRDGPVEAYLAATRDWAVEQVRELHRRDPALSATDRHGETWTVGKVLRRLLYHSLDHLGELDRHVARAEGAADRLLIRRDVLVDMGQLDALLRSVGWYRLVREPGRLARLVEGSTQIVSAWDDERLVGFARAMSDDAAYGLITTVAVHPSWQGKGLARRILLALVENTEAIRWSLSSAPGAEGLYESAGFVADERAMVRRRSI